MFYTGPDVKTCTRCIRELPYSIALLLFRYWFACSVMVYIYTFGFFTREWFARSIIVYMYTVGVYVRVWLVRLVMVYIHILWFVCTCMVCTFGYGLLVYMYTFGLNVRV